MLGVELRISRVKMKLSLYIEKIKRETYVWSHGNRTNDISSVTDGKTDRQVNCEDLPNKLKSGITNSRNDVLFCSLTASSERVDVCPRSGDRYSVVVVVEGGGGDGDLQTSTVVATPLCLAPP